MSNTLGGSMIADDEAHARAKRLSAEFGTTIAPGFGALTFKASRGIADQYDLDYICQPGGRIGPAS